MVPEPRPNLQAGSMPAPLKPTSYPTPARLSSLPTKEPSVAPEKPAKKVESAGAQQPASPVVSLAGRHGVSAELRLERFLQSAREASAVPTGSSARSQPSLVQEVSPEQSGNALSASGFRVGIESVSHPGGSAQTHMDVVLTAEAAAPQTLPTEADLTALQGVWLRDPNSRIGVGFTDEELAFRAKWGWAAFNTALRSAFEQANAQ